MRDQPLAEPEWRGFCSTDRGGKALILVIRGSPLVSNFRSPLIVVGKTGDGRSLFKTALVCYAGFMATQQRTIEYLIEQAAGAGTVLARPMFGEYGVYVDGKMIGSVCDDQLYVKPTASGRRHAEPVSEALPYPGAKPNMLIEAHRWDDAGWLGDLLRITAAELPMPRPRKPKRVS